MHADLTIQFLLETLYVVIICDIVIGGTDSVFVNFG